MKSLILALFCVLLISSLIIVSGCAKTPKTEKLHRQLITAPEEFGKIVWEDDFESYQIFQFPFKSWVPSGNANSPESHVTDIMSVSSTQSLQLFGIVSGNWGAMAYREIGITEPFEIEFSVFNGPEMLSGPHPNYGGIELSTGPDWKNEHRGLIKFTGDREIRGGAIDVDEGEGLYLGDYLPELWYKTKVRYEIVSPEVVSLSYWINDEYKGKQSLPSKPYEKDFSYIGLWAGEGTAWYDDVKVYKPRVKRGNQK